MKNIFKKTRVTGTVAHLLSRWLRSKKHLDLEIKLLLKRQENCTKTISLTLFVVTKFFVTLVNFFRGDINYQDT